MKSCHSSEANYLSSGFLLSITIQFIWASRVNNNMVQKREYRLIVISLILLLTLSHLSQSSANTTYSKTWEQSDGSELEITISSVVTNLWVNTKYTYRINLEAKTFGSNLGGFYSIAIGLRFTYSHGIIKSDLRCEIGDLSIIGSKVHI